MKPYQKPEYVEYGSLVQLTGIFGHPGAGDVLLTTYGDEAITADTGGSIDGCAQDNGKCKCFDNGTC